MTRSPENIPMHTTSLNYGSTPLIDWGLILVEGPDAATLLQSQLSNSVVSLRRTALGSIAQGLDSVRLVGYCSPKGRLLASAWLGLFPESADSDDRFALFISKDIAASTAKRLSMYVLRSKVKVVDASSDWEVFGSYQHVQRSESIATPNDSIALQIPDVLAKDQSFKRVLFAKRKTESTTSSAHQISISQWNSLEVLSAIPRIVLATQEQFVPQMVNFESVAGVDFKKGCYPGQEIVARSQYRGAVKRRLQLSHASSSTSLLELAKPGVELFQDSDASQPCGMVVLAAANPENSDRIDFQLECKLDALEAGEIHLGNSDGPVLKIDQLPYPLLEI
ncbi:MULTISPECIES: folate-binding protein [unclassified Polynucleobacter]|uniref:CAF17-like 4Fe-4S cluster assembly/insertion protein YgfZ n=1 Tax=unclassified Polynucleobacter TaxID=2640945 RepID=UPI000BD37BD4|nr:MULTISPECIES: folate-binding protein [unclassified Polynucleobacter]OYY20681.1 MAG: glycine cleavage system protein T [Polynucleobacter sp. 35-46-11]OZA76718.1 MAG: glycine cleavage system protein T [Polynucleobacter sp. 39-46-10]